jgi:Tfp pilus assembly protein PilW
MYWRIFSQSDKIVKLRKRNSSGLSLVEILVSIVILSLVLFGFVNLFISGKRFIIHSRLRMTGGELGRYFLDPLQAHVRQDTWNQSGNPLTPSPAYNGSPMAIDNVNYTPNFTVISVPVGSSEVRKVKVNIIWNESSP